MGRVIGLKHTDLKRKMKRKLMATVYSRPSSGKARLLQTQAPHFKKCMKEAGVDGTLIVQPINHKFDHTCVTSVLRKYPSKFVGCCLANPAEDGSGIKQLEDMVLKVKIGTGYLPAFPLEQFDRFEAIKPVQVF